MTPMSHGITSTTSTTSVNGYTPISFPQTEQLFGNFPRDISEDKSDFPHDVSVKSKHQKSPKQEIKESSKKSKKLKPNDQTEEQTEQQESCQSNCIHEKSGDNNNMGFLGTLLLSTKKKGGESQKQLEEKLHAKIAELRRKRKADDPNTRSKKRQRLQLVNNTENLSNPQPQENDTKISKLTKSEDVESGSIEFSTFSFSSDKPLPSYLINGKRKRLSTQALLSKAEKEKEQLKELESTPEGEQIILKSKFAKAIQKAQGITIKDDPLLLRKTLKKKEKKKQKSTVMW